MKTITYIKEFGFRSWLQHRARPDWTRICWKHRTRKTPNMEWYYWECLTCREKWRSHVWASSSVD